MKKVKIAGYLFFLIITVFLIHRFTMEIRFFNVSPEFERPQAVTIPDGLNSISAESCGSCHEEVYKEWKTSIHSQAWTDPYFQVDYEFDGSQQICLNCHTPLVNQQENLVTGFRDSAKFEPILEPNPNFDPSLKNEGVTCAVCHIENNIILGRHGIKNEAHEVKIDPSFSDGNGVCRRCHQVFTNRWDTFLKMPLCGTFAEVEESGKPVDCQQCHMDKVERPLVPGGPVRSGGKHLWLGGHDQANVASAIAGKIEETSTKENIDNNKREYTLFLTNIGAHHRLPTGTPDRHLEITFRLLDKSGKPLKEIKHIIQRVILWRPFMVDLWDTRIPFKETVTYPFSYKSDDIPNAYEVEAIVRYGLLRESRRLRIGYKNSEPIIYEILRLKLKIEGR